MKNGNGLQKLYNPWIQATLFLAVVAIPVILSAVTFEVSFERSKSVEFCASCHVMTRFVDGLSEPDSDLLAAKHYQFRRINKNQCYTCHSDYDLWGPVKAKMNGLRHMAHYYFGEAREPKLYKPFPNDHCLQCHDKAKSFVKAATHQDIMESLRSNETSCITCHGPVHPEAKQ
jgi:nitrate/TMAO reductase-like tetraheme cytochrome c subunit